jgi:hypothetical protein
LRLCPHVRERAIPIREEVALVKLVDVGHGVAGLRPHVGLAALGGGGGREHASLPRSDVREFVLH